MLVLDTITQNCGGYLDQYDFGDTIWQGKNTDNFDVGVITLKSNGKIFNLKSTFLNNKLNGNGVITNDKGIIVADITFCNNAMTGYAKIYDEYGYHVFLGQFENGYRHGFGREFHSDNTYDFGSFENDKLISKIIPLNCCTPVVYQETSLNGDLLYLCSFDINFTKRIGIGLKYSHGQLYRLVNFDQDYTVLKEFYDNNTMREFDSNGTIIYEGQYHNDFNLLFPRNGRGCEYNNDGIVYNGYYFMNKRQGNGLFYEKQRLRYDGCWVNDLPQGAGCLRLGDELIKGIFNNGFVEKDGKSIWYGDNTESIYPGATLHVKSVIRESNIIPYVECDGLSEIIDEKMKSTVLTEDADPLNSLHEKNRPQYGSIGLCNGRVRSDIEFEAILQNEVMACSEYDENKSLERKRASDLSVSANLQNVATFNHFVLDSFWFLEMVVINTRSFIYVTDFQICELDYLTSIAIGNSCFSDKEHENKGNSGSFKLRCLPRLKVLTLKEKTFTGYEHFLIEHCNKLETITIGDYREESFNFAYCRELTIENLPNLKTIEFGANSFFLQRKTVFNNLPSLKSIKFGDYSFCGDNKNYFDQGPKLYFGTLSLCHLPVLEEIIGSSECNVFTYHFRVDACDIPKLDSNHIFYSSKGNPFRNLMQKKIESYPTLLFI